MNLCFIIGKNKLLWMIGEIGEVIDIVKKYGDEKASCDPELRKDLIEEMADVLMYYHDVLLRYHVTSDEISSAFLHKHKYDLTRDYSGEYKELYHG